MKKKRWIILGVGMSVLLLLAGALFVYYSIFGEEEVFPGFYRQKFRVNGNQFTFVRSKQDHIPDWDSFPVEDTVGFGGTLPDNEVEQIQQILDKCRPIRTKWDALAFAKSFPDKLGVFGSSDVYAVNSVYYYEGFDQWRFVILPLESIPVDSEDLFSALMEAEEMPIQIVIDGKSMDYIYGWRSDYREVG